MKKYLSLTLFLLITAVLTAQGTLRGTVTDDAGEPAMFANILVKELGTGTTTDLDGNYNLKLDAGTYTIEYSYVGLPTLKMEDVVIVEGEVNVLDVALQAGGIDIVEVVVTGEATRTTAAAMNTLKMNSAQLLDGVTKQTFKRTGDSDASGAIARVTGVSVQGGKYVFVRGLGDRYTKTILNNMDVPGLDPDRNSIQMDIFPTNLIDNIVVMKTFSPDLPGDFTGGVINIETKEFPEEKTLNASVSIGYNPAMHFNSNYLSYQGSSTDFLGFDDGTRDLPTIVRNYNTLGEPIPTPAQNKESLTTITNSFSKNLAAQETTSPMNFNFSLSGGNQYNFDNEMTLGINAALNYRNTTTYFEEAEFNQYLKNDDPANFEMQKNKDQFGSVGSNNVFVSGLVGAAIKSKTNKISLTALHLQNGQSTAGDFIQNTYIQTDARLIRDNLEYNQRSLSNALLKGEHNFKGDKFKLEWKVAPTYSILKDKDIRLTSFRQEGNSLEVQFSEGAVPTRIFRDLEEFNLSNRLDFTTRLTNDETGRTSKIKVGASYAYKQRDYGILNYQFNIKRQDQVSVNGDPDRLLAPENVWDAATDAGTYAIGNFEPSNTFEAEQRILGAYVMNDWEASERLRVIYGVRAENFQHIYTGQDQGGQVFDNETLINNWSIFPSANIVYTIVDKMNIRGAYSKTVARPSFKEASIAQIYDALSDRTFIGNINLIETDIDNFDLRWEMFQDKGQMFSVSAFYKTFKNPIELLAFKPQTPNDFQPKNVGDASILGLELEFRKNLSFLSDGLSKFEVGSNVTLVESKVEMDDEEYNSRLAVAREGEIIERTRQMQGQSPYIVNAFVNYLGGFESGWEGNLSYNVQGPALFIVGIGANPDVFQQPFHSLNFKLTKGFGENNRYRAGFRVTNILDAQQLKLYESYLAMSQNFERFVPGRTISLNFSYRIY